MSKQWNGKNFLQWIVVHPLTLKTLFCFPKAFPCDIKKKHKYFFKIQINFHKNIIKKKKQNYSNYKCPKVVPFGARSPHSSGTSTIAMKYCTVKLASNPPLQRRNIPQCTKNYCTNILVCVKCAGNHKTIDCTITQNSNNIKCALCGKQTMLVIRDAKSIRRSKCNAFLPSQGRKYQSV